MNEINEHKNTKNIFTHQKNKIWQLYFESCNFLQFKIYVNEAKNCIVVFFFDDDFKADVKKKTKKKIMSARAAESLCSSTMNIITFYYAEKKSHLKNHKCNFLTSGK